MTTQYYTYSTTTRTLAPAPKAVRTAQGIVCNPTAEQYAAIGAYPKGDGTPLEFEPPKGKIVVQDGYALQDGAWRPQYRYEDAPPPPPVVYSKYKLVRALQTEGVWLQVKEWLQSQDGAWDLYLAAEDISEDEPLLSDGIAAAKEAFGWTDEKVAAVLDAAEIGGA